MPPCPHCGQECLSFFAKASLGPALRKRCKNCQKYVSVAALPSTLVMLGGMLAGVMLGLALSYALGMPFFPRGPSVALMLGVVVVTPLVCWLYYRKIPLVSREA